MSTYSEFARLHRARENATRERGEPKYPRLRKQSSDPLGDHIEPRSGGHRPLRGRYRHPIARSERQKRPSLSWHSAAMAAKRREPQSFSQAKIRSYNGTKPHFLTLKTL